MQLSGMAIATGAMTGARVGHAMALTARGVILICGGKDAGGTVLATAELYVMGTGLCIATGSMNVARYGHTATLLTDGRVLIVGGQTTGGGYVASAEYFYPPTGVPFPPAAIGHFVSALTGLTSARAGHLAVLTSNGQVLIAGGADSGDVALATTELYVPATAAEMSGVSPF
jgi:hypothetical protein